MLRSALRRKLLTSIGLPVSRPTLLAITSHPKGSNLIPLSVAPFSASMMTMSVTEAVTHDHRELVDCYNNIIKASGTDTAIRWQNQFVWELARHSIGEELVVYPAFEKYLGETGIALANKDRNDHSLLKVELRKFQDMHPTDAGFCPTLDKLFKILQEHVKDEEANDLPTLERALTGDATADIAKRFERTKMFAPTRSHPNAPDRPPFENVAGLLEAPMDRLADIFRRFPDESTPRAR